MLLVMPGGAERPSSCVEMELTMHVAAASFLVGALFTYYPGLGDRPRDMPRMGSGAPRIEAVVDKGPLLELIVACRRGSAILSYSKVERVYCGPRKGCDASFAKVARRTCD